MKHFKNIMIILLLVLFQTIALQVISQVKYITGKDTLILYTKAENRAIAALLYKGAYLTEVNQLQAKQLALYCDLIAKYKADSVLYSNQSSILQTKFDIADSNYVITNKKYQTLQSKHKIYKRITYGSIGLNALLLILLL